MNSTVTEAQLKHRLIKYRSRMNRQDYRTLWGQIKAGDIDGANKGLTKILIRNMEEARYV